MVIPISCVLLAGGKSSRLGRDKQKEIVGGVRICLLYTSDAADE